MENILLQFWEPMELPDQCAASATVSDTSHHLVNDNTVDPIRERSRVHLPRLLDQILDQLSAPTHTDSKHHHSSFSTSWNKCNCATEYLEVLRQVIPLLTSRSRRQQARVSQLQTEITIASTQAQRHNIYIDQETVRGNLSIEARTKYQQDAKRYEKAKIKNELYPEHYCNINELGNHGVLLMHELTKLLEKARKIEEEREDPKIDDSRAPPDFLDGLWDRSITCESPNNSIPVVTFPALRITDAAMDDVSHCCRAVGRILDSLLDAEQRELVQIGLKLEGWENIDDVPDAAVDYSGRV